jgi:hypothetical protein
VNGVYLGITLERKLPLRLFDHSLRPAAFVENDDLDHLALVSDGHERLLNETISPLTERYNPSHRLRVIALGSKHPSLGILLNEAASPPLTSVSWRSEHPLLASFVGKRVRLSNHAKPLAGLTRWSILIHTLHHWKHL